MEQPITYRKFTMADDPAMVRGVVRAFADVFSSDDDPSDWAEGKRCQNPECGKQFGRNAAAKLTDDMCDADACGSKVLEIWTEEAVLAELSAQVTDQSSCYIAMRGGRVVGFCWGFQTTAAELAEYLKLPVVADALGATTQLLYFSEVGVVRDARGQKVAKSLIASVTDELLKLATNDGTNIMVTRTMGNEGGTPSNLYEWFTTRRMEQLLFTRYSDIAPSDRRVIFAGPAEAFLLPVVEMESTGVGV